MSQTSRTLFLPEKQSILVMFWGEAKKKKANLVWKVNKRLSKLTEVWPMQMFTREMQWEGGNDNVMPIITRVALKWIIIYSDDNTTRESPRICSGDQHSCKRRCKSRRLQTILANALRHSFSLPWRSIWSKGDHVYPSGSITGDDS